MTCCRRPSARTAISPARSRCSSGSRPTVSSSVDRPVGSHTARTSSASATSGGRQPRRAASSSCRRGVATSGPTRRQTPRCSTSWPPSRPARTSSRTKRTLPWLAVQSSVTVLASTGPREDQVHQGVDRGAVQVVEVDPPDPGLVPQRLQAPRHALGRAHGGDQEEQVGVDELADQRGGRAVEEVQVVDEQHERSGAGLVLEHRADLGHHRHQVAPLVAEPRPAAGGPARRAGPRTSPPSPWPGRRCGRPGRRGPGTGRPGGSCRRQAARG